MADLGLGHAMRAADAAIRGAYRIPLEAALDPTGPAATMLEEMRAEAEARRAALTPEERRIEDLEARVRELEWRLAGAREFLDGTHECHE